MVRGVGACGKSLAPGSAPEWAGEAPSCQHGEPRKFKSILKHDGTISYLWECAAKTYPDPEQCPAEWINKKEGK